MATKINVASRAAHAKLRRDRTQAQLMAAAVAVLAEHGGETTIDRLAAAAGVSRGTFYNYFPTLPDLYHALAGHLAEEARVDLGERLAHIVDPAAQLAASGHYFLRRTRREPIWAWATLNLESLQDSLFPTVPRVFRSIYRRGVEAGRFRAFDPEAANVIVAGTMRAAQRRALVTMAGQQFDDDVIAMMLSALGCPGQVAAEVSRETAEAAGVPWQAVATGQN